MRYLVDKAHTSGWWGLPVGLCSVIALQRLQYLPLITRWPIWLIHVHRSIPAFLFVVLIVALGQVGFHPVRPGCSFIYLN